MQYQARQSAKENVYLELSHAWNNESSQVFIRQKTTTTYYKARKDIIG